MLCVHSKLVLKYVMFTLLYDDNRRKKKSLS